MSKSIKTSKKNNNNNNNNNSNSNSNSNSNTNNTKECQTEICEKFIPMRDKKLASNIYKMMTKKMFPANKKTYDAKHAKFNKKQTKKEEKEEKEALDMCMKTYCNKGCKGTIFEDGKEFPKSAEENISKKWKDNKSLKFFMNFSKQNRKEMFKNKTSVLKDNFYEKLNKKQVKLFKSHKAISGCANMIL